MTLEELEAKGFTLDKVKELDDIEGEDRVFAYVLETRKIYGRVDGKFSSVTEAVCPTCKKAW